MARMLAKQAERRPADAHEFVRELRRIEKFQRESEMTRRAVAAAPASAASRTPPPLPPSSAATEPAPEPPLASPGARTPVPQPTRRRIERTLFLLAGAAIAAAALLWFAYRRPRPAAPVPEAPVAVAVVPTPPPAEVTESVASPEPTPLLPTPGPEAAADATVGATRLRDTPVPRPTRARPSPVPSPPPPLVAAVEPAAPAPAPAAPARPARVDAVYETRGTVRFTSSPEQARLYVDGRYVGIADDWDNRGGGRPLELEKEGTHYVRMELPGYRPLHLQIDVTPDGDDSISIDEELDRRERVAYEKLPAVYDRTTSEVEFSVTPPEADVSEDGKALGRASDFGSSSPLKLSGPTVHDLMLSAPGYRPKLIRILVAPNAGKDRAKVTEKLKTP
jgi:hypothetical protein